ncbi:hypothetical protein NE237_025357 [Protea cynaroides]|uniref:Uncharacterized protein n=1 Tax=Protea cynaroides TaxID=273540 RepID=A0A9Q0K025_9MAGN|nr:hypothetical protein NE237_025357 [Protea cynaroides]
MEFHVEKARHKADKLDAKQHSHLYGHHQHQQHGQYQYAIPTPGGEYPMGGATTAGATPMTGGPTRAVAGQQVDRLDAKQQPHLYGHDQQHKDHKYPIPTPGGEYPMVGATTGGQQPHHVHHHLYQHEQYEYPIPTPGGEHLMGGNTTGRAAPMNDAMDPTRPVAGHPSTTKYL